jgi:thiol-disulfide isomerase/thioredoxin
MLLESEMRLLIAISFALSAFMLLAGCDSGTKPAGQAQPATPAATVPGKQADTGLESASGLRATLTYRFAGQQSPGAAFTGADGRDVSLPDFAGRPLLVNIWATWCAPCKAEMPTLDALAVLEEGRISVIAVSQDLQGRKPVAAFFKSAGIANLEPYTDPDNALLAAFGNNISLPTTILYDSDGREVWRVVGGVEWDDAEMAKLLREAA